MNQRVPCQTIFPEIIRVAEESRNEGAIVVAVYNTLSDNLCRVGDGFTVAQVQLDCKSVSREQKPGGKRNLEEMHGITQMWVVKRSAPGIIFNNFIFAGRRILDVTLLGCYSWKCRRRIALPPIDVAKSNERLIAWDWHAGGRLGMVSLRPRLNLWAFVLVFVVAFTASQVLH